MPIFLCSNFVASSEVTPQIEINARDSKDKTREGPAQ